MLRQLSRTASRGASFVHRVGEDHGSSDATNVVPDVELDAAGHATGRAKADRVVVVRDAVAASEGGAVARAHCAAAGSKSLPKPSLRGGKGLSIMVE